MIKKYLFILLILPVAIFPQQKRAFEISDIYKVKYTGAPSISPAGDKTAFTVTTYQLEKGKSNTEVYIINSDGTGIENITNNEKYDGSPIWSGDGKILYFISARNGSMQLYSYDIASKEIKQLTDFYSEISMPVISPDGKHLAFAANVFPECGADQECNKKLSESTEKGPVQAYIADNLLFRHWTEYQGEKEPHIFIYNFGTKEYKDLTTSAWATDVYKLGGDVRFNFSPDSKELCFMNDTSSRRAFSTNADLFTIPVEGGTPQNITGTNKSWDGGPIYSPDGKYIAFKMQTIPNFEADRYRIAVYNRDSKIVTVLTEDFDYTVNDIVWTHDSKSIYFDADFQGYTPIYRVDIATKKITPVSKNQSIFGFDISDKGELVYNARSTDKPAELFRLNTGDNTFEQITNFNKELLAEVDFRPAEQAWVEGAGGKKVHVFIVKPHDFDPNKKYPLILNVHGGPQSQWMDAFRGDWQVYPGKGYIVAFANPHGSTGYGSEYTEAISGDWGGKVYDDIMKVTDYLETLPYVDKNRIGAMGWSFGGYMMDWLQGQTKRFKCLASMMGIFDMESMWGATEELWFAQWDLKGYPWESNIYKKYSASSYVENFSTPTLIITGEKDYRVPYTQSIQFFTTLQALGIDSRLIIFPNDGHWPNNVKSMPLYYNAHLEWFHKYLGGGEAPWDSKEMVKNNIFK